MQSKCIGIKILSKITFYRKLVRAILSELEVEEIILVGYYRLRAFSRDLCA